MTTIEYIALIEGIVIAILVVCLIASMLRSRDLSDALDAERKRRLDARDSSGGYM